MDFASLDYLLLLGGTAFSFFRLGPRSRLVLLVAASLVFYAVWNIPLTGLILISAGVDFWAGRGIERSSSERRRRLYLAASMVTNLGLLGFFKYANFFIDNINAVTGGQWQTTLEIVLPPGISFYTFQTMSYTIDVYRGAIPAARSGWQFLVYVSFFPQLIAGPIERAGRILWQIEASTTAKFRASNLAVGARMITWGLFKKVLIADHCGAIADQVFADPSTATFWSAAVGTYAFTIQIYCDFSAYSEIACGSARLFGIRLVRNFDQPYLVQNVRDFWRRWHISLSNWFRDYVYRGLGGNRNSRARTLLNLTVTMFLSGLWHGAAWNFVLWGLFHGVLLVVHQLVSRWRPISVLFTRGGMLASLAATLLTFHLVVLGWVLFRVRALSDLALLWHGSMDTFRAGIGPTPAESGFIAFMFGFLGISALERRYGLFARLHADVAMSTIFYATAAILALLFGREDGPAFIYFQF